MNETHSSKYISNKEKKSKHKYTTYPVQLRTSQRKIGNNIQEKLFLSKVDSYNNKQNVILENFLELIKIHQKCLQLSKKMFLPKNVYIEDIEQVVARIVHKAFGMRVEHGDDRKTGRDDAGETSAAVATVDGTDARRSPGATDYRRRVLDAVAGELRDVCARHRRTTAGLVEENERLRGRTRTGSAGAGAGAAAVARRGSADVARDVDGIMGRVRDAVSGVDDHGGSGGGGGGGAERSASSQAVGGRTGRSRRDVDAAGARPAARRDLRERLALAEDRLRAADKAKRDLQDALRRYRDEPTAADALRVELDREKSKNVHLQSVVDEMFAAVAARPGATVTATATVLDPSSAGRSRENH